MSKFQQFNRAQEDLERESLESSDGGSDSEGTRSESDGSDSEGSGSYSGTGSSEDNSASDASDSEGSLLDEPKPSKAKSLAGSFVGSFKSKHSSVPSSARSKQDSFAPSARSKAASTASKQVSVGQVSNKSLDDRISSHQKSRSVQESEEFSEEDEDEDERSGEEDDVSVDMLDQIKADQPEAPKTALNWGLSGETREVNLSEEDLKKLRDAFEVSDEHKLGVLGRRQFARALASLGMKVSVEQALLWFEATDIDKDELINLDEFIIFYWKTMHQKLSEEVIEKNFEDLWKGTNANTAEGHKFIPATKFREIMTTVADKLTDEEADEMLRDCKADQEGRIFFQNYMNMLLA